METLRIENLFARRSIRAFADRDVSDAQITLLLKAAMAAPSAGNRKPWHFVVVRDRDTRTKLAAEHPHASMLPHAPVCIVPCGEPRIAYPATQDFWVQDLSAATVNMLLAAVGLGLGAVWCGVYPGDERVGSARRILGIPENIIPFAYVAVGHPAESKPARTQFDQERVHDQRW